jgi:sulfate transport system ATP-binding protein
VSIVVKDIRKRFGAFTALDGISLDFPSGQLIALLGPSGCGKTTLLRIIAGLEWADSGRVLLGDQDASDRHVRERQVGFVFQHYALFKHLTVFENVAFGLRVRPRATRPSEAQIRKRVGDLLELVQLAWAGDRYPSQLSGGQRQRIALARALAVEPRVLLLDEPFGALDAQVRKELRGWLRKLHVELHLTSIFVTHDQDEAHEVADRVVLMNKGRVEQVGATADVYERPETAFACAFLGAVNRLPGRIEGSHINLAGDRLPALARGVANGEMAVGFARPHELRIEKSAPETAGVSAKVDRILLGGSLGRVELTGVRVLNGSGRRPVFEVDVPREQLVDLDLKIGDEVRLTTTSQLSVFPYDADTK